ncbi:GspE/PulE family protein [Methylomarinum vadi]|uniref:GspE/PulE family protein n=1 Tax=Methylomarinum vadi TaxID=438855 RepID=UPI0004DF699E|nr:GspE/PulE family protein [Methylomarinum vadi]
MKKQVIAHYEHRMTIDEILEWMLADKLIDEQERGELHRFSLHWENRDKQPIEIICDYQETDNKRLRKRFTEEKLSHWVAARVGLPYFFIDPLKIDVVTVTAICSQPYAERFGFLPVAVDEHSVTIATSEPFLREWEKDLGHMLKKQIKRVYANGKDIARYTQELYAFSRSVKGASSRPDAFGSQLTNLEQLVELGEKSDLEVNNQHIVNLVNWLFEYAFDQRASDIHLEPRRDKGNVRFRIDGVLHHVYELPPAVMDAVTSRIKTLGRMNIAEKRRPQDGRLKTLKNSSEVELRLSTMPTAFGEKLVMRIFDPEILLRDFSELGFNKKEQQIWREMSQQAHGIILVTGPTGSGKTTTLYSTLKQLATPEVNVCTVEDPIELIEPTFNQMQVQHNIGLNFASGIRTLMRQDPDIIMVGEIRDLETAEMAIQASLTGHLVLSTLHTNNAPSAVTRLLELGVKPYLIKLTLLGVMAQRLIRTLCPKCKQKTAVDESEWQVLVRPFKVKKPETIFRAVGCNDCRNTGYAGRIGIYEVFRNSPAIQKLIVDNCDAMTVHKQALLEGMRTLRLSGVEKVLAGLTSIEEVLRVAPESMEGE